MEANALGGPVAILLPGGTYTLNIAGPGEDAATSGDLDITGRLLGNHPLHLTRPAAARDTESRGRAGHASELPRSR